MYNMMEAPATVPSTDPATPASTKSDPDQAAASSTAGATATNSGEPAVLMQTLQPMQYMSAEHAVHMQQLQQSLMQQQQQQQQQLAAAGTAQAAAGTDLSQLAQTQALLMGQQGHMLLMHQLQQQQQMQQQQLLQQQQQAAAAAASPATQGSGGSPAPPTPGSNSLGSPPPHMMMDGQRSDTPAQHNMAAAQPAGPTQQEMEALAKSEAIKNLKPPKKPLTPYMRFSKSVSSHNAKMLKFDDSSHLFRLLCHLAAASKQTCYWHTCCLFVCCTHHQLSLLVFSDLGCGEKSRRTSK